jgi:hypothetical protein
MSNERRYRDDEVEEILAIAVSKNEAAPVPASDERGLTLAEIQDVGQEVGVTPARIAEAARSLEARRGISPRRTFLGLPISVGRAVELPRAMTDEEWQRLVPELRETFDARGRVGSEGAIREWTNGNLHIFVEQTGSGHRLRMRTVKGGALVGNRMGLALLALSLLVLFATVVSGSVIVSDLFAPMVLAAMGGGALLSNALTLPRWAREREGQMEDIGERVLTLMSADPEGPTPPSPSDPDE